MDQDNTVCSVTGCGRERSRREYCSGHYKQALNGEELRPLRERVRNTGSCAFNGCEKPFRSKGLCGPHYGQYIKGEQLRPLGPKPKPVCSQNECHAVASTNGLCQRHYQQQWIKKVEAVQSCRVEECENGARFVRERLCGAHYQQKRAGKPFTKIRTSEAIPCAFDGCDRPSRVKGLCEAHAKQRSKGNPLKPIRDRGNHGPICTFPDCGADSHVRGLCVGHYAQHAKGRVLAPIDRSPKPVLCTFAGCEKPYAIAGLCYGHYAQRKRGASLAPLKEYRPRNPVRSTEQVMSRDVEGRKQCIACGSWQAEDQYFKSSVPSDGLVPSCKTCIREEPYNHPTARRAQTLIRVYKLTPEEWESLFVAQGSMCASCGVPDPGPKGWCVDHDHSCCPSGKSCGSCVRGILCQPCNLALGITKDDPNRLRAMAAYLDAWREHADSSEAA